MTPFVETPTTWPDPPAMSVLHAILLFVGVPALLFTVITLLVMAPSLAKGPRYRPGQQWNADRAWFGAPELEGSADPSVDGGHQLGSGGVAAAGPGAGSTQAPQGIDRDTGGASVRW